MWCNDLVMDAALDVILDNVTHAYACSAQPTTYAEATSTYSLGGAALSLAAVTKANGAVDGRRITIPTVTITGTVAGIVSHIALVDGDTLYYVNELTALITWPDIGYGIAVPAFDIEFGDPS